MEDVKKLLKDAWHFRHATKEFNGKKIPEEDVKFILESGRLSPSSYGVEPWKFIVIKDPELKEKMAPFCYNQPQITTCSDLVIICKRTDIKSTDAHFKEVFSDRIPAEKLEGFTKMYGGAIDGLDEESVKSWAARQAYIALGNMMHTAAMLGIDSCPMEGFDKEALGRILELDMHMHAVVLMPLGYSKAETPEKVRKKFEDVVEFR